MLRNFRAYQNAIKFYHLAEQVKCAKHLREQLLRAASSIALNLAEGSAQPTQGNRSKYYHISLGSLRECQTVLDLARIEDNEIMTMSDQLAAELYKLCRSVKPS